MTEADCHVVSFSERLREARVPPRTITNEPQSDTELLDCAVEAHPRKKVFDWFICSVVGLICFPCTGIWAMYYSLKSYTAQMQDEEADRKRFNRKVKCFSVMSIVLGLIILGSLAAFIVFISKNVRIFADDPVEYNLPKPSYKSWGFDGDNTHYDNWPSNDGNVKHMQQGPMKPEMIVETTTSSYDDYDNEYGSDTTPTYDDYSNNYDSNDYDGDDYLHDSSDESEPQYYDKDPVNYYDGESEGKTHESGGSSEYDYTETNETASQENVSSNEEPNYQYYNYPEYEYRETNESQSQDKENGEKESYFRYNDYPYYDYTETNETDGQDSVTSTDETNYQYNNYPTYDYTETDDADGQSKGTGNEEPNYQYYDYPKYDNTESNETDGQDSVTSTEEPNYQYNNYPTYDYTETDGADGQSNGTGNEEPNYQYYDYPKYDNTESYETDGQDKRTGNEKPSYQYYDYPRYDYTETNETDGQDSAYSNEESKYYYYENGVFVPAGGPEPIPVKGAKKMPVAKAAGNNQMDKFSTDYNIGEDEAKPVAAIETDGQDNVSMEKENSQYHNYAETDQKEINKTDINNNVHQSDSKPIRKGNTVDYTVDSGEMERDNKDDSENIDDSSVSFQYKTDDEDKKGQQINWLDTVTSRISADVITTPLRQKKENPPTHRPLWRKLGYKK